MISVFQTPQVQNKIKTQNKLKKDRVLQLINMWKTTKDKQYTGQILQYLKPTINSALKSFGGSQQQHLKIQAAKLALASLQTFDPAKNIQPSTHVFHNLQRLNRIRRDRQNIIHIPQTALYQQQMIAAKQSQLQDQLGREPSIQQLSDFIGMSAQRINKIKNKQLNTINQSSAISQTTGQSTFSKKVQTDKDYLQYTYKSLGPIQQKILQWSTGMYNKPILSNQQIAAKLQITPGAVSQRKARIQQVLSQVRGLL